MRVKLFFFNMTNLEEKSVPKQNFKALLETYQVDVPQVSDVVECEVIAIDKGSVRLDIAGVTVGVVRGRELFSESTEYSSLKVGHRIEATVIEAENENGEMELSFRIAGYKKAWDGMRKYSKDEITIKDLVEAGIIKKETERIKILGQGDMASSKTIHAHKFSQCAQKKIEDAGGKAVLVGSQ